MELDLVIRGGTVATAADVGKSDVGVKDGRIVALAEHLPRAASEIDASGLLVLPGGIDSHVHFDQPLGPGNFAEIRGDTGRFYTGAFFINFR